ncbi:MAG: dihydroorotate dehydrogenase electron transfer subunit [Gammaproteobacteria bacterium]
MSKANRNTILLEDAEILHQVAHPADQFVLTVRSPRCAAVAKAGSFAHLSCDPALPMRRPLSIMRADPEQGTLEFLYKIVGDGLRLLADKRPGDRLSLLGPIGVGFRLDPARRRPLLIGGGVGIPPMIFLADTLRQAPEPDWKPLVLMGSEVPFPFATSATATALAGIPATADYALDLLEDWGIPSRLASAADLPGCYRGFVTELAREWLASLSDEARAEVVIYACGPTPMLEAATRVAQAFGLPCQVSLEEYMACAVGGCAGCAVPVHTAEGLAMKRVCVDGPVFDADQIFPPAA